MREGGGMSILLTKTSNDLGKKKEKNTRQDNLGLVGDLLNVHRGYFQHYFLLLTDGDGTSNYEGNLELFTILLQIS